MRPWPLCAFKNLVGFVFICKTTNKWSSYGMINVIINKRTTLRGNCTPGQKYQHLFLQARQESQKLRCLTPAWICSLLSYWQRRYRDYCLPFRSFPFPFFSFFPSSFAYPLLKKDLFLLPLKAFSWETDLWVGLGNLTVKNANFGMEICIWLKIDSGEIKYAVWKITKVLGVT